MKTAEQLMTGKPVTISIRDRVPEIVGIFLDKKYHSLPVVDDEDYPIGLLTEFELTRTFIYIHFNQTTNDSLGDHLEILEIPSILKKSAPIPEVVRAIGQTASHRVLIIDDETNTLCGIVSPRDVLKFLKGEHSAKSQMRGDLDSLEQRIESMQAEKEQLEQQIHLYSRVYEDSPYMMHSVNKHGIIMIANRKLHKFLGYKEGELVGRTIYEIYPKTHHSSASFGLEKLKSDGAHSMVYTQMRTIDGWEKPVDVSSSAVYDQKKQFVCTITISREINTEEMWKALQTVETFQSKYGTRR